MPDWTPHIRPRLAALRLTPPREAEIVEEFSQHLDQRYEELLATGTPEREAQEQAIAELLEPDILASRLRPLRQANVEPALPPGAPRRFLPADLWQDGRYAARMLLKHRGFAAAAILTLALGIGANSAMFALVDAVLLQPLPFAEPDRLVMLWEQTDQTSRGNVSPLNMLDWERRSQTVEAIGGFVPNVGGMVMSGEDGTAETVPRQWVTAGVFDALGVQPILGRTFQQADDTAEANVAILTESFWRTRFHGDPGIVGRDLGLDGTPFTVVGVVPDEARVIGRTSLWALYPIRNAPPQARGAHVVHAVGRLKAGVTVDAARADVGAVAVSLAAEFPATNAGRGVTLEPMHDAVTGSQLRQTSMLFLGVVGVVLLICCANVANLLLVRATARQRELAVRSALGANRFRVIRQLLTESVLLSVVGGAAGLLVGAAILRIAPAVLPPELLPATVSLTLDGRVVAFCAATALLVGVLFGLAPAWQATRLSSSQVIASGNRSVTGRGRIRALLVAGEVAAAVVLLVGAGLLLRTLLVVQNVDRGYRAPEILTMIVDPLGSQYPTAAALQQFFDEVEREVADTPGVRSTAWASTLPLGFSYAGSYLFEVVGAPSVAASPKPSADYQIVSPTYFETVDLPLLDGRAFTDRDTADSPPVCIVNEAFVRTHLAGRSPLGQRVAVWPTDSAGATPVIREVVGVAHQVKGRPDETEDLLQIYVPLRQDLPGDIFLVVRPTAERAAALAGSVRRAIGRVDKDQLVSIRSVVTLDDVAREAIAPRRFRAILVMAFAALALILAMIGLFGTLAYSVQQHLRDFGVRRALGASTGDIARLVAVSAGRLLAAGGLVGVALAMLLTRLIGTLLFGVEPLDPVTYLWVGLVLVATAMVSIAGPTWRATRVDPAIALRTE